MLFPCLVAIRLELGFDGFGVTSYQNVDALPLGTLAFYWRIQAQRLTSEMSKIWLKRHPVEPATPCCFAAAGCFFYRSSDLSFWQSRVPVVGLVPGSGKTQQTERGNRNQPHNWHP